MSFPAALGLTLLSIILLLIGWYAIDIFLLAFAGILLAVFFRVLTNLVKKYFSLPDSLAVTTVLATLLISTLLLIKFSAPTINEQFVKLINEIPDAWKKLQDFLSSSLNLKYLSSLSEYFNFQPASEAKNILLQVARLFTTTFGLFGSLILFLVFGISLAYDPETYKRSFLSLVPSSYREKAKNVFEAVGETLSWWVIGRIISMSIIGALTTVGLWLLGVPLALILGLLAALLSFVPNIGPTLSLIPAALIALIQSPLLALYVILLYLLIQALESYLFTPLIERRTVQLPPALIIFTQVLMALLTGILGLALATPLLATLSVLVKKLYIDHNRPNY